MANISGVSPDTLVFFCVMGILLYRKTSMAVRVRSPQFKNCLKNFKTTILIIGFRVLLTFQWCRTSTALRKQFRFGFQTSALAVCLSSPQKVNQRRSFFSRLHVTHLLSGAASHRCCCCCCCCCHCYCCCCCCHGYCCCRCCCCCCSYLIACVVELHS